MKIDLPDKVKTILNKLAEHGYEAYTAGGCVRDSILGRIPGDWDITTSAMPQEVKALFPRTVDTGIQHGTVTVMIGQDGFEVTTYRVDGDYEDCRHPKEVTFTRNLPEDLRRRDFTINAMAYNEEQGLVDLFDGIGDLKKGIIRCVGCARERFQEDALRMMRAVRFAAQLGFEIEEETKEAISLMHSNLKMISAERLQAELVKLITSDHPEKIKDAWEMGITETMLPEFDLMMKTEQETPHHCYNVGEHTLKVLTGVRNDKILRLSALLHDTGKPAVKFKDKKGVAHFNGHGEKSEEIAKAVLKRLKFDNNTLRKVCRLVRYHDYLYRTDATPENVRQSLNVIGAELFPLFIELRRADVMGQSDYHRERKLSNIDDVERYCDEIMQRGECFELKGLAVTGKDLLDHGVQPGKEVGDILEKLLALVIQDPAQNTKEDLLEYAEGKRTFPAFKKKAE